MSVENFMQLAINEAWKGHGFVSPNPKVGAVLVKEGRVVATGYHQKYGGVHAEVNCLQSYGKSLEGDEIMYVTLEPCAHIGQQPSCAEFLIEKGVRHVVIASLDPNPKVAGQGIVKLEAAGVRVEVGLLEDEATEINKGFFKHIQTGKPYFILKMAMNMMGQIAPLPRERVQITGLYSRKLVEELRASVDAILVGNGTLRVDDPELAVDCENGFEPKRIVWGNASLDSDLKFFRDQNYQIISQLEELNNKGITSVLVEGGAQVFTTFLEQGLYDEVYLLVNEEKPGFKAGLLATEVFPLSLRQLEQCEFKTQKLGIDRLYHFKLLSK